MSTLDDLTAAVARNTTVTNSAITLLTGLKGRLETALAQAQSSGDLTAIQAEISALDQETTALANAVSANTPADTTNPAPASTSTSAS